MSGFTALAVQKTFFARLIANTDITDIVPASNIKSWLPDDTQPPYIQSGDSNEEQGVLDDKSQQGTDHTFEIEIVVQPKNPLGVTTAIKTLQLLIYDEFDREPFGIDDGFVLEVRYLSSSTNIRDANKKSGIIEFLVITSS